MDYSPSRLFSSHFEFLRPIWLSHHHGCDFVDSARLILFLERTWQKTQNHKNENRLWFSTGVWKKTRFFCMYQFMIHGCKIDGPYEKLETSQETIMRQCEKTTSFRRQIIEILSVWQIIQNVGLFLFPPSNPKTKKGWYCWKRMMTIRNTQKTTRKDKNVNLTRSRRRWKLCKGWWRGRYRAF